MIGAWLQSLMGRPRTAVRRKLVIVAFNLANQWSHHYNELLGYKEAARSLELVPHILVPSSTEPALAAALSAAPVIEPPPAMVNITIDNLVDHLVAFADTRRQLASLWAPVETHDLRSDDFLLFPVPHPAVVASVGEWLARRAPARHPSVFFRFTGGEVSQRASGRIDYAAILFRLVCSASPTAGAGTCVPACRQFADGAHADSFLLPAGFSYDIAEVSWFNGER
jgi:hypothetical protein